MTDPLLGKPWKVTAPGADLMMGATLVFQNTDVTVNDEDNPLWGTGYANTGQSLGPVGSVTHNGVTYALNLNGDFLTGSATGGNLLHILPQGKGGPAASDLSREVLSAVVGIALGTGAGILGGLPLGVALLVGISAVAGTLVTRLAGQKSEPPDSGGGSSWTAQGGG